MFIRKSWTKSDQADFLVHLGKCLKDGYPLLQAIRLQTYRRKPVIQETLERMIAGLEEGIAFHDLLKSFHFPIDVVSSIYFSEVSGNLPKGLIESGEMMRRREENKTRLQRLMRYPLLLIWMLLLMLYTIGHFLLPNFLKLYQSLSLQLPLITRILLFCSGHMNDFFLLFLILIILSTFIFLILRRLPQERQIRMAVRIPLAGRYLRHYLTHKTAFHIGSMIRSGLSVRQSVEALKESGSTAFLNSEASRLSAALSEGESFEELMADRPYYLPDFVDVIHQGEINGILGEALYRYSEAVMSRMEQKTEQILSYFQPTILLLVGSLVLGLFSAVLLPIFHIVNGL
ncbi:MAG: competence type IV pilus assembly protein ComGB [Sporolactobacillus sp.]